MRMRAINKGNDLRPKTARGGLQLAEEAFSRRWPNPLPTLNLARCAPNSEERRAPIVLA